MHPTITPCIQNIYSVWQPQPHIKHSAFYEHPYDWMVGPAWWTSAQQQKRWQMKSWLQHKGHREGAMLHLEHTRLYSSKWWLLMKSHSSAQEGQCAPGSLSYTLSPTALNSETAREKKRKKKAPQILLTNFNIFHPSFILSWTPLIPNIQPCIPKLHSFELLGKRMDTFAPS